MSLTPFERLTPTQRAILAHLEKYGTITERDIAKFCYSTHADNLRAYSNVANVHIMKLRKAMPGLKLERVRGSIMMEGYWKLDRP